MSETVETAQGTTQADDHRQVRILANVTDDSGPS